MFEIFKQRPKTAARPNGWTQEMLSELFGESRTVDELTNYIFLITRVQREVEIIENGTLEEVKFYGRIGSPEHSPLRFVRVIVHTLNNSDELKRKAVALEENFLPLSKGYMALSTQEELYGQPTTPILHINVVGGKDLEEELINSLSLAKQFGNTYLPLWIWTRIRAIHTKSPAEMMELKSENFPSIEKCRFQQALDLHGSVAQNDILF